MGRKDRVWGRITQLGPDRVLVMGLGLGDKAPEADSKILNNRPICLVGRHEPHNEP